MKLTSRQLLLLSLIPSLVAVLLYWPTLGLPLIYDDLLHIRLASEVNGWTVWIPTDSFAFYRPLVFIPLLIIKRLFGYYPALLLHGLNVAAHAVNVFLLLTLAWRLWGNWPRALLAGLLLAVFPFGYQAVVMYGNNIYPVSAGLMLLGLHSYLSGLRRGRRRWWMATALIFLIFVFSHETAVLLGPIALLLHRNERGRFISRPVSPDNGRGLVALVKSNPWLPLVIAGALYIILYQFLPRGAPPETGSGSNDPGVKLLYFLQIGSYPLSWLGRWLPNIPAHLLILAATFVTLIWTVWAGRQRSNRLPLLLGWGWWGLASLLLALSLPTTYLTHGTRLLYLGAVGLVLAWSVLLLELARLPRLGAGLAITVSAVLLTGNFVFVTDRLDAYDNISQPAALVAEVMVSQPPGEGVLLVNLPQWQAPPRNIYPIGAEFVTLMGDHLFAEELVVENLNQDRPVLAVKVDSHLNETAYGYGIHNQTEWSRLSTDWAPAGSHIFISTYEPGGIETIYAGAMRPGRGDARPLAILGPYRLLKAEAAFCNGRSEVTLIWDGRDPAGMTTAEETAASTSVFVQLLDENGLLIGQSDGPPLQLRPDRLVLPRGWQIIDRRGLVPETGQPAQLLVGVYDFLSGERAAAHDNHGVPLADNAWRVPISPCDGS